METDRKQAGEGLKKSLLQAARKCDMGTMSRLLDEWRNIDLSFQDETGKTLLHHCTSAGDKENSILLLERGAPTNQADNMGLMPIHYAAKKDYTDIVENLVTHGASVNATETKTGQTALHITVTKNFVTTAQFLLFSGSDASLKDKQGKTPIALCRSKEMRNILAGFSQTSQGGLREIQLQTVEMKGGAKTYCDRLDLTIDYTNASTDDIFSVMCRKQAIDYSDENFALADRDEVFSDVINYRLGRKGRQTTATLTIPVFGQLEIGEELVLKGNRGFTSKVESLKKDGSKHYCTVTIDMSLLDAFVIVSRPAIEVYSVGLDKQTIQSSVKSGVELVIRPDTFDQESLLNLEITDPPDHELFTSNTMEDLYSCTYFCSVYSDEQAGPKTDILYRLPLPEEFGQGGELHAFESNAYEIGQMSEASWTPLDTKVTVSNNHVEFSSRTFSVKTCIETKKGVEPSSLTRKVHSAFEKAQKRQYNVMFLVMSKRNGNGNTFTVVVECVKVENAESRKLAWVQDGYIDQKPTQSAWFDAFSRNKYRCKLGKSLAHLQASEDSDEVFLQFHARRINYQCFTLQIAENHEEASGDIQIFSVPLKSTREENKDLSVRPEKPDNSKPEKPLTTIYVQLSTAELITPNVAPLSPTLGDRLSPTKTKTTLSIVNVKPATTLTPQNINFKEEAKGDPKWTGFTNDAFLRGILSQLDEEWYKVMILNGMSFQDVNMVLHMDGATQEQKIFHFLLRWRDSSRARDDLGMSSLITAVTKGGRRDICTSILLEMKEWFQNDENKKFKFWRWVNKAFTDSDIYNPGVYPIPMSDEFLVLMTDCIENINFEIAVSLGLSRPQAQAIQQDDLLVTDQHKLLVIFVEARDRKPSRSEALRVFIKAMEEIEMLEGKKWIVMASINWLQSNKKADDPFLKEVEAVLRPMNLIS